MAKRQFPNGHKETRVPESDAGKADRLTRLASLCQSYDVQILYAFRSHGREAWEWVQGKQESLSH